MPKDGFRGITIRESTYDDLFAKYRDHEDEFSKRGINSFSGYIVGMLYFAMRNKDVRREFFLDAPKHTCMPDCPHYGEDGA